jgi:hypothetical protein
MKATEGLLQRGIDLDEGGMLPIASVEPSQIQSVDQKFRICAGFAAEDIGLHMRNEDLGRLSTELVCISAELVGRLQDGRFFGLSHSTVELSYLEEYQNTGDDETLYTYGRFVVSRDRQSVEDDLVANRLTGWAVDESNVSGPFYRQDQIDQHEDWVIRNTYEGGKGRYKGPSCTEIRSLNYSKSSGACSVYVYFHTYQLPNGKFLDVFEFGGDEGYINRWRILEELSSVVDLQKWANYYLNSACFRNGDLHYGQDEERNEFLD